jgi:PAS domain S-box-containing protein
VTLSSIGEAVIATNAEGSVTFINPVAESLTGWPGSLAKGKPLNEIFRVINEINQEPLMNPMENLLNTGKISSPASRWMLLGDKGAKISVRISGSPIVDKQDHFQGIVLVFRDISLQRRSEKEKDSLIADLKAAMSRVKKLSGLLPICASCKNIRDDRGYWNQIEAYIRDNSEAEFSHSICPDCVKKLYPGLMDKND